MISRLKILTIYFIALIISGSLIAFYSYKPVSQYFSQTNYSEPVVTWWGGSDEEGSTFITVDSSGNLYVTCFSQSFGIVGENIFLIKYDVDGHLLWNVSWETDDMARPYGITIDSNEDIIITGTIVTEVDPYVFSHNVFVLKYNSTGSRIWDTIHMTSDDDDGTCIALDSNDDIYIGGGTNSSSGSMFIQKYSSDGGFQWVSYYGTTAPREWARANGIVLDSSGDIYIAGTTDNSGGNLDDILLVKFDSTGNALWNTTWGGPGDWDHGHDLVLSNSDIFVIGSTNSLATKPLDAILVKYNSTGHVQWNKTLDFLNEHGHAITLKPNGNIIIAGETDYLDFLYNYFVAEYNPNGVLLWNATYDSGANDYCNDVVVGFNNSIFVGGRSYNETQSNYDLAVLHFYELATITGTHTPTTTPSATTIPTNTSSPPSTSTPTNVTSPTTTTPTTGTPTSEKTGFIPGFVYYTTIIAIIGLTIILKINNKRKK
ncbi:MAG: hypothetical protein GF308_18275 [Candidatus Heimdallarchaeota archaeon]|nr:hypothetical protein [Candidatus Heimdallarchaeota archaeon]